MALDFKPNFFTGKAAPAPSPGATQMMQIAWSNDPIFRRSFGMWLYAEFDTLMAEHKQHGRFLSLQEIENPLE